MVTAPVNGIKIGPTSRPPWNRTLAPAIFDWTDQYLLQPDGPNAGEPWDFTGEQAAFIANWYAIDDQGRFVYRYGMLRRMKGWGKDPLGAVLCCVECFGPCRFSHWDGDQPVAKSHPAAWIQTAAVSKDQTRNTMTLFPGMISPKAIAEYGVDIGKEIIYADRGRRRIEAVTSSPRALEGGRATFILKNESHHWRAVDEGHEMAKVIARNAAKSRDASSRVLAISNAHAPGEDSDAEHDYEAWKGGNVPDMLYDSLEAPETDLRDDESLRNGIRAARGDSHWLDIDRLMAEIRDPRTSPATARRFYLNQIIAEEDRPFSIVKWNQLVRAGYRVAPGALITLGFDGSLNRDHTALIGTEIRTGHQWVVGYWKPEVQPNGELSIPFAEVDETVQHAFETWDVHWLYGDPSKWGEKFGKWAGLFGKDKVVAWSPTLYHKMATSLAQYRVAIETGLLTHDGDQRFSACIGNAYKHMMQFRDDDGELMWILQKERPDSPLKIDAAQAGCFSWQARNDAIASGALKEQVASVFFA